MDKELLEQQKEDEIQEDVFVDVPVVDFDEGLFLKGVDEISLLAGKITGLVNVGIHPTDALNYFLTLQQYEHEKHLNSETCKHNIEVAKHNAKVQAEILDNRML